MKAYQFHPGRVHLVRLATDSDLADSVTAYATEHGIGAASVTFLGAVKHASLRYYDQDEKVYRDFDIDEHLEIVAGVGNISMLDEAPFLHIHAAFADSEGRAFGGHVNAGTIVFATEVTIHELDGQPPVREPDDCTGLTLWGGNLEAE
ncbi:MAG: DNA-binding protein, partial [Acidimicrobiia bacterium]|nr:DNA-binding protein [Acidimicrobiia bacterium]